MPNTQATATTPTDGKETRRTKQPVETQPTAQTAPEAPEPRAASAEERLVDQTIRSLEMLYRSLTGRLPPATGDRSRTPIPVERDPGAYVSERLALLCSDVESRFGPQPRQVPWSPAASAWENDREIVVCVDLPGVAKDAVDVDVEGRLLTVSGRRAPSLQNHSLRMGDGPFGAFERRFALPERAADGSVQASLQHGVMEIRVPKVEAPRDNRTRVAVT